jgi:saccharopine dehydrogenase-like NADP-dependent oxidoreductase
MEKKIAQVLILGGRGHIGHRVVTDLLEYTQAQLIITGRTPDSKVILKNHQEELRVKYLELDLADHQRVHKAIAAVNLVIHCAGPFRWRDTHVLETCIKLGVNYVDVSDDRVFTEKALTYQEAAREAGVTAVINTGVFPGISNSMVRQAVEQVDTPEEIHIRYVVIGSGGAGVTVMRTTFLGLLHPFAAWMNGQWQMVKPFTDRERVHFPKPFGEMNTYWFDMPESITLVNSYPVKTVTTKFGTSPDLYNQLTQLVIHGLPKKLMQQSWMVNLMAQISYRMTTISDRFSGTGVAMRIEVKGHKENQQTSQILTFTHPDAATATGHGTGSIAQLILSGQLQQPGVWPVEQILPTSLFLEALQRRKIVIYSG